MYPPHHIGGYETMWQVAMDHASAAGHEVRVVVSDYRSGAASSEAEPNVRRVLRWYWDLDRYEFHQLGPMQRLATELHNGSELMRQLREFRPDVISWWSMSCISLSLIERVRRIGIPAVFVVHDDWIAYGREHDQWIRMWRGRRRWLAPLAERLLRVPTEVDFAGSGSFVFNSRYTLERARRSGVDVTDASVIHPGIEQRFQQPLDPRPWGWRTLYVGRLDRQKGVDTAVRALARLPAEATLAIWGTGQDSYVEEMRELARALGVASRVRFNGWADAAALPTIYGEADVVVFPVRWEEPFGLVPLEAMGTGRPVVTTARGGTREFVRDGENALIFDSDDDDALADCIRKLAALPELRERLRRGGLATAARHTVGRFAEDTLRRIVQAADRDGPTSRQVTP